MSLSLMQFFIQKQMRNKNNTARINRNQNSETFKKAKSIFGSSFGVRKLKTLKTINERSMKA